MTQRALDAMRHYFAILWSDLSLQGKLRGAKKLGYDWARECHDIHGMSREEIAEAICILHHILAPELRDGLHDGWPW